MPCGASGMSGPLEFTLVTGPGSLIFLYIPKTTPTNPHSEIHHPKTKPGVQSPFNPGSPRFASNLTTTLNKRRSILTACTKESRSDNRKSKNNKQKLIWAPDAHRHSGAKTIHLRALESSTTLQFANSLAETPAPPLPITHES